MEGFWLDGQKGISKVFINEFTKRFTSKSPMINLEVFDSFSPCISDEENKELIKVVTDERIHTTLSQINSLKALRPDGL